jgi:alpha-D-xyloside xylohydrolase
MLAESPATSRAASVTPNLPQLGATVPDERQSLTLHLEVVAPRVVRLRLGERADDGLSLLIEPEPTGLPLAAERQQGGAGWTLTGGELTITIGVDPFSLRIARPDGPSFTLAAGDANVFGQANSLPLTIADGGDEVRTTLGWSLTHDEHLYGLGERFVRFDQRGRRVCVWNTDAWGTATDASYKGAPIVFSSVGYAIFLNTGAPLEADLGATSAATATLTIEEGALDCFIFLGADLRAILGDYTALTGRMSRLPRWAFGLWTSPLPLPDARGGGRAVERLRARRSRWT